MSKIEAELVKATDIEQKRGEERPEYLARLGKAVGSLDEKDWDKLSEAAQDWFNGNADKRNAAKKAGKPIPDWAEFPDAKKAEDEDQPRSRRRNADEDEDKTPAKGGKVTGGPDLLKEGLVCEIETTRGKTYAGEVIELSKKDVVIKTKDDEVEISVEKVAKVSYEAPADEAPAKKGGKAAKEEAVEPHEGAEVEVVTKRGKELSGTITELTDDELVLKTDDGEIEELRRDRIETIKVLKAATKKGGKAEEAEDEDKTPAKKGGKKGDDAADEKAPRTRNAGVSIGTRIMELMADNLDATEADIAKLLTKEKLEFKENTLALNYTQGKKFLDILKERKLLKA